MPYKGATTVGNANIRDHVSRLRWPSPTEDQLAKAEKLEYEHSSFSDPGEDWNKARLYDASGSIIAEFHQSGF